MDYFSFYKLLGYLQEIYYFTLSHLVTQIKKHQKGHS